MKDLKELYKEWLEFKDELIEDVSNAKITQELKDKAKDIQDFFSEKGEKLEDASKENLEKAEKVKEDMKENLFNVYYNKVKPLVNDASNNAGELKEEVEKLAAQAKDKVYQPEKMKEIWEKLKNKVK